MEILCDLQFINGVRRKEKEEGRSLPLHSAFSPGLNYSALAATT